MSRFDDDSEQSALHVSFCCNNEAGEFVFECAGVQVEAPDGELVISFVPLDVPMRWEVASLILDTEEFECGARTAWVGNRFWDATRMTVHETERLVRWLIANAGAPTEWNDEHPIGQLAETELHAS